MTGYSGVWVYAEHRNGVISKNTLEILGKGRELADKLCVELSAVLFGCNVSSSANVLTIYGADKVYVTDDEKLRNYKTRTYARLMTELILKHKPEIVLFTASTTGRDLAPRVAARLRTGLTANCIDLDIGDFEDKETGRRYEKILYQIVPAFGGNVVATIVTPFNRPQMATVRPGVFPPPEKIFRKGEIVLFKPEAIDVDEEVEVLEVNRSQEESSLENAKIVVGGGLGVGGPEGFKLLKELADSLGGCVGVTRPVTDAGWMPYDSMIGESGRTIRPDLYIACGISGALHHMIGVRGSRKIVAINNDPKAPIFEAADYIVIGDLFQIVPKLTEKVKKYVGAL
ncbi:MAG: electron transfer flavoprotein subunit alpha/FixB family protein [Thaumarchaeota archaeon]|nr:electron transfer flavoprotein subunit alpha/FixB family protein [Nitrososphaerota archaeon]